MLTIIFLILGALIILALFSYLGFYAFSLYGLYVLLVITVLYLINILIDAYKVAFFGYAPYVRSSKNLIKKILEEVDFKENSIVCELGCGDGRFLRELAKNKKVNSVGYEYSFAPYLLARLLNFISTKKVKLYFKDFFKENLSNSDYIFCYLITKEMDNLRIKFERELKPGATVISNTFAIKNWQPNKIIELKQRGALSSRIYIYNR